MLNRAATHGPPRNRWVLPTVVVVFSILMFFMFSMQRAGQRRYTAALSRLERTNAPRNLDDLASREMASENAADARLAMAYPELDAINARVFRYYDDDGMTTEGQAEMEDVFREDPALLAEILELSESKTFWSRRRFDALEEVENVSTDQLNRHTRTFARYLQHVSLYAHQQNDASTAVHSATAILRLANLLASQPLTEQCYVSYVLRGMSLSLLEHLLESPSLTETQIREVEDVLTEPDADATFVAMLETERAVRISEYERHGSRLFFRVHAMVNLLDFFEKRTLPSGTMGMISMGIQHGEFLVDVNTLDSTRARLRDQERHVLNLLERAKQ
jgi:hypothetical protein